MLTLRRVTAALTLLAGLVAPAVAFAPPALAHAVLLGSDPADGSRLDAAPTAVTLRFSERTSVGAGFVRVVGAHGDVRGGRQGEDTAASSRPAGTAQPPIRRAAVNAAQATRPSRSSSADRSAR